MHPSDLQFLLSPAGQTWLQQLDEPITPHNHLQIAQQLRQQLPPNRAHAVLETVLLRQKAAVKFSRAREMYFLREALEQASGEEIAAYRAQRFAQLVPRTLADLGCGIGGDALALGQIAPVIGVEQDEVRLAMARQNVAVYGGQLWPLCADLTTLPPLAADALFFDPARRDETGRRIYSVHDYMPPLSLVDVWRQKVAATAVKISPGVHYDELPADAEVEFISVNGELKEAVLWFGGLRTAVQRRATLLPSGNTLTNSPTPLDIAITPPQGVLYEPDPAVIRAHLVQELAAQLGATMIDAEIAYLTAVSPQPTPFARCYTIEATFPFQLKQLRHYLRQHQIGNVTIKKRGSPLEPDTLKKQLRLRGPHHRMIILTQAQGQPIVLIGQPMQAPSVTS